MLELLSIWFINVPIATLLTGALFGLALRADRRLRPPEQALAASYRARFLIGAVLPAAITPVLVVLALYLGTLEMQDRPGSAFYELGLLLVLVNVGALFYSTVLLVNDRLVRRPAVRLKRHALLVGTVVPAVLVLLSLAAAERLVRVLFEALV